MFHVAVFSRPVSGLPTEALASVRSPAARTLSEPASVTPPLDLMSQLLPVRSQLSTIARSPAACTSTAGRTCTLPCGAPLSPRMPPASAAALTPLIQATLSAP